jgi:hypothetical protein
MTSPSYIGFNHYIITTLNSFICFIQ